MLPDCGIQEVSLMEALKNAHRYKGLAGEMEAQNVAMLRLLIAVIHTVFTRVDPEGRAAPVDDERTALERWAALFRKGCFPEIPIRAYLEEWRDRFWLFDDAHPFYQAPGADNGTANTASKLNGEVSESNNKARLFSVLSTDGRERMTPAESARWLVFINGFDDCAAKQRDKSQGSRSITVGWLGKLGLVTAVGDTLFDTILLNMPMLTNEGRLWEDDDLPVWELPKPCEDERRTIPMPKDLAGLFTLQSRRVLLVRDGMTVTGYKILGGDAFSEQNALAEPMTLWRRMEDKKSEVSFFIPRRHDRARQIWRDFGAIVNVEEDDQRPGVVEWCSRLQTEGLIPSDRMITFRIACVRYDSSQSSSITDSFSDALSFHANLLTDAGRIWIREINQQLDRIERAASEVGSLAANLGRASGQHDDELRSAANGAKEQFFLAIDLPFREWLIKLVPEQSADERASLAAA